MECLGVHCVSLRGIEAGGPVECDNVIAMLMRPHGDQGVVSACKATAF